MARDEASFKEGLVQGLIVEIKDMSYAVATFSSELKNLRENVIHLSKILKDGNGQASLLTRFSLLEHTVVALTDKLTSSTQAIEKINQEDRLDRREQSKNKWSFYATMVPGLLALVGSVLALVIR